MAPSAVMVALLEDLAARDLHARQGLLFVVDGSKAIASAVAQVFGAELADPRHRPRCLALHHRRSGSVLGCSAALRAEPRLYRIAGYSHLPILAEALDVYAGRFDEATARAR